MQKKNNINENDIKNNKSLDKQHEIQPEQEEQKEQKEQSNPATEQPWLNIPEIRTQLTSMFSTDVSKRFVYLFMIVIGVVMLFITNPNVLGVEQYFAYSDFSSNYVGKNDKKIISEDSEFSGIFTYGPYINLNSGNYEGTIKYEATEDIEYQLTTDFGKTHIVDGVLSKDKKEEIFDFTLNRNVTDNSIELRTKYKGVGDFELLTFSYKSLDESMFIFAIVAAMIVSFLLAYFLIKSKYKWIYLLYIVLLYLLTSKCLLSNPYIIIPVTVLLVGLTFGIYRFKLVSERIIKAVTTDIVPLLLTSFLILSIICYKVYDGSMEALDFVAAMSSWKYIATYILVLHIIVAIKAVLNRSEVIYITMFISSLVFAVISILSFRNIYLAIGIILILGYFNYYILKDDRLGLGKLSDIITDYRPAFAVVVILCIICAVEMSYVTICRYKVFSSATFDFGIFAQMYENMAKTGIPVTTCERGYELSHLYIHFSLIYYLFLPIYMIFRTPLTLFVIQAFMVFSASIPLFLICKRHGIKPVLTALICVIYMLSPAIVQPLMYDFHENKFLPFFILWFIYFFDSKKYTPTYIFLLLTLIIKEDTPIYMIIIALYYIIRDKQIKHGCIVLAISAIYFVIVIAFIQSHGLGLMEGHYKLYYLSGQSGFSSIVMNIIYAPGYFIKNVFAEGNFQYIIYTLGSLLFIPLINKDLKMLILIIPFVVFGLMTDYKYQHDIGYQYTYGLMTIMFYAFILNLKELKSTTKNIVCLTSLCAVIILHINYRSDFLTKYTTTYKENIESFKEAEEALKCIPEKASVTATTFIVPHLYTHEELYRVDDGYNLTDYYAINNQSESYMKAFEESEVYSEYELCYESDRINIYKLPSAPEYLQRR